MSNPLISVIVPVYKAEAYLERCVNSIRSQTYENLEIILVDDGSPDRCGEMCDTFAAEDSRIRVFHKENGGQSSARNLGLNNISGEYVGFVDSDDWIEPDMYRHLYDLIVQHNAQIACCGVQKDFFDGSISYFNRMYPRDNEIRAFCMPDALRETLRNERITYSPCDKLYHKDVFDGLRMTEGKIFEDMEILPKWIERADIIVYDPVPKYHYIMTESSTIRGKFNLRRMAAADVSWMQTLDYKERFPQLYEESYGRYIATCLSIIHESRNVSECADRREEMILKLSGDLPAGAVKYLTKNERVKLAFLRFNPRAYEILMNVYQLFAKSKT